MTKRIKWRSRKIKEEKATGVIKSIRIKKELIDEEEEAKRRPEMKEQ